MPHYIGRNREEEATLRRMQEGKMRQAVRRYKEIILDSIQNAFIRLRRRKATSNQQNTPANIQPSRPDNIPPRRPDNIQPSRPDNIQPSRPDNIQPSRPANIQPSRPANIQPSRPDNIQPSRPANIQPSRPDNIQPSRPANIQQSAASTSRTAGGRNETLTQAQTLSTKYNFSLDDLPALSRINLYPNLNDRSTTHWSKTTSNTRSDAQNNDAPNNDAPNIDAPNYGRTAQQDYPQTTSQIDENAGDKLRPRYYSSNIIQPTRIINGDPASVVRDLQNDFLFYNRNIRHGDVPIPSAPLEDELPQNSSYSASRQESSTQSATARGPRSAAVAGACNRHRCTCAVPGASNRHRCACGRTFSEKIYQCIKGHSACVACRFGGEGCDECGARVLNMRNYALEAHIEGVRAMANGPENATGNGPRSATVSGPGSANSGALNDDRCACGRAFSAEVYQCSNGHSTCDECRNNGLACGECGVWRLRRVEADVRELKLDCPNTEMGCSMRLRRLDMESHLRECIYRKMDCPLAAVYGRCTWRGRRGEEMLRHLDERHASSRLIGVGEEAALFRLHLDERAVHVALLHSYFFLVHVKVSQADQTLRMAVQLLGKHAGAAMWKYELHIYSKAEPRRKFTYADICTPDGDRIEDVFGECRCLAVPLAYARGYMTNRGLNYKFYISKTGEGGWPQRPGQRAREWRGKSPGRQLGSHANRTLK